jgi:hypothetical protein
MMGSDRIPGVDDRNAHPVEIFHVPGRNTGVQCLSDTGDLNINNAFAAPTKCLDCENQPSFLGRTDIKGQNSITNITRQHLIVTSLQVAPFATGIELGNAVTYLKHHRRRQVKLHQNLLIKPSLHSWLAFKPHQSGNDVRIQNDHLSKSTVRIRALRTFTKLLSNSFHVSSSYGIFANSRASFVPAPSPTGLAGRAGSFAALSRISRTSASRLTPRASARRFSRTLTSSDTLRTRIWAICDTSDIMISKPRFNGNVGAAT